MEQDEFALRKFVAPEFILGTGARNLVARYAKNLGTRKVLLVTDPGVQAAGWTDVALIDPVTTTTMSRELTADTAMGALCLPSRHLSKEYIYFFLTPCI